MSAYLDTNNFIQPLPNINLGPDPNSIDEETFTENSSQNNASLSNGNGKRNMHDSKPSTKSVSNKVVIIQSEQVLLKNFKETFEDSICSSDSEYMNSYVASVNNNVAVSLKNKPADANMKLKLTDKLKKIDKKIKKRVKIKDFSISFFHPKYKPFV